MTNNIVHVSVRSLMRVNQAACVLEKTLAPPRRKASRRQGRLATITSMSDLLVAVEDALRAEVQSLKDGLDAIEQSNRENHPVPFASLTVEGCVETAQDLTAGGARFNASGIQSVGIADLANSLAAIEDLVFERREITLSRLAEACAQNFKHDPVACTRFG